jgi:hypothetical protein
MTDLQTFISMLAQSVEDFNKRIDDKEIYVEFPTRGIKFTFSGEGQFKYISILKSNL